MEYLLLYLDSDVILKVVDEGYSSLYKRVFKTLINISQKYLDNHDWIIKADDDTYVRIPQLLKALKSYNSSEAHLIGKHLKHEYFCWGGIFHALIRL